MQKNLGAADRITRGIVAVLLGVFILLGLPEGAWAIVLGALGAILLVTAVVGICPLYIPFGLRTSK